MGVEEDVATYVAAGSTGLTEGTNVFVGFLPESTRAILAVQETAGGPPTRSFSSTAPVWENASVQLLGRSTLPSSGASVAFSTTVRSLMHDAWLRLEGVANATVNGSSYLRIEAVDSPYRVGRDERGRWVYAANFDVMHKLSTDYV